MVRLNGQSTAKIAATVISANTNHSVIKRFPGGTTLSQEAPMRRFTPPAASPAIDNCGRETWTAKPQNCRENGPAALSRAGGGFALAGHRIFGRPAHQRRIVVAEQDLAEADRRLDLHLPVGARLAVATAQRLHQPLGGLLDVMLQVGIGPQRDFIDREFAG